MATAQAKVLASARNSVLVVDDQPTHRTILEEVIGALDERLAVKGCDSAAQALAWAAQNVADLVLVDYLMPGMDGIELVKRLRRLHGYQYVPIVMVTVSAERTTRYAALDAGVTDFLTKPVNSRECLARCRNLLTLRRQQLLLEDRGRRERTNRTQAEEALRMSEAQLRLITDQVPAIIAYLDRDLRYRFVNRRWLEAFGPTTGNVVGRHLREIHSEEDCRLIEGHFREALAGQTVSYQRTQTWAGGEVRHYRVHLVPHADDDGQVLGCYGMALDISAEVEQRDKLEREVTERTASLAAANRELESFSYTVSHDLRAPLRHVASFVGMLGKLPAVRADAEAVQLVARAEGAAARLWRMTEELLRFAQLGRQHLRPETIDLQPFVAALREELSTELGARRVEWTVGELPAVRADRMLLRLALQNLLDNALKYTGGRDPAQIEVSATQDADTVTLCVRDNGAGFDMQYAGKLFGTFARMHNEAQFPGTGVGLAHVKRIVERHGGTVWAEAAPDRGAAFFVRLPR